MRPDRRFSHVTAKRQVMEMGETIWTKTGRLIHTCPAQTAALAEINFIRGA